MLGLEVRGKERGRELGLIVALLFTILFVVCMFLGRQGEIGKAT